VFVDSYQSYIQTKDVFYVLLRKERTKLISDKKLFRMMNLQYKEIGQEKKGNKNKPVIILD